MGIPLSKDLQPLNQVWGYVQHIQYSLAINHFFLPCYKNFWTKIYGAAQKNWACYFVGGLKNRQSASKAEI